MEHLLNKYNLKIALDNFKNERLAKEKIEQLPPLPPSPIDTDADIDYLYSETIDNFIKTIENLKYMKYILKHSR